MSDWKNVQYKDGKLRTGEGGGGGSTTLAGLDDVNLSSPSDGQILQYDNNTSKWVNATPSGSSGHNYSTTEQVVGTWIDGKPIYEKTMPITETLSLLADTWVKTEFDRGNISTIIDARVIGIVYGVCHLGVTAGFVDDKLAFNSFRNISFGSNDGKIILQYTKTTD